MPLIVRQTPFILKPFQGAGPPPGIPLQQAGGCGIVMIRISADAPFMLPSGMPARVALPCGGLVMGPQGLGGWSQLRQLIAQGRLTRHLPGGAATAQVRPPVRATPLRAAAAVAPVSQQAAMKQLLKLVNVERVKAGVRPLTLDPVLNGASRKHSADMARRNYFNHVTPEGKNFAQRAAEAGTFAMGENIAGGGATPEDAMRIWMNSPGHRKNILHPAFSRMGGGVEGGRWTQMFG